MISQHDPDSERVPADAGFEPDETHAMFGFVQPLTGGLPEVVLPAGYAVRSMTDTHARSRADAARLSFRSAMEPDMHRARYRRFMASPAYEPENDLVVIAPDGEVAAFAIVWPDDDLGSGQFERSARIRGTSARDSAGPSSPRGCTGCASSACAPPASRRRSSGPPPSPSTWPAGSSGWTGCAPGCAGTVRTDRSVAESPRG
jgi:hypothetical protein